MIYYTVSEYVYDRDPDIGPGSDVVKDPEPTLRKEPDPDPTFKKRQYSKQI